MLKLRYYQIDALKALDQYLENEIGNPLISIPTGGGKSLIIASFVSKKIDKRILLLTHRKELIEQNYEELSNLDKSRKVGIYSSSLLKKEIDHDIVFASIQSFANISSNDMQNYDYVLIDEAHLVSPNDNTRYFKVLTALKKINPKLRIIGLSATPYRLVSGMLTSGPNQIFNKICYQISLSKLINEGYLCNLISRRPIEQDLDSIPIKRGDYSKGKLEDKLSESEMVDLAIQDLILRGKDRKSWLIFGIGKKHLKILCKSLKKYKVSHKYVETGMSLKERSKNINLFKTGKVRALINIDILTTGFNISNIDLIAMFRPTKSTGLYVQMVGRGLRNHPKKQNCLVLDYANNISEHGPIDKIKVIDGDNPYVSKDYNYLRVCKQCKAPMRIDWIKCKECGTELDASESKIQHEIIPSDLAILEIPTLLSRVRSHEETIINNYNNGVPSTQIIDFINDDKIKLSNRETIQEYILDILKNSDKKIPLSEWEKKHTFYRFHETYKINNRGCWEWNRVNLMMTVCGKIIMAKRYIWQLVNHKTLDRNDVISSKCNNRHCVNPSHFIINNRKDPTFIKNRYTTKVNLVHIKTNKTTFFDSLAGAAKFLNVPDHTVRILKKNKMVGDYKVIKLTTNK